MASRRDDEIEVLAPAKLNLHLEVLFRRADGYHEIETVIQAIDLFDRIRIRRAPRGVRLSRSGPQPAPAGDENLAYLAAAAALREAGTPDGVEISLEKRIPIGGGLGGGSSDAAAVLAGVNDLLRLGLPPEVLVRLGAGLGSDVPFFLAGTSAICRGRGERVEPIPAAPFSYLVLWPGFGCSTREVYGALDLSLTPQKRGASLIAGALASADPGRLSGSIYNRLEEAAVRIRPELAEVRRVMERFPLLGVGMTGSGSCLYGVLDRAEEEVRRGVEVAAGGRAYLVRGLAGGAKRGKER